jgi:hypothetical protein
MMIGNWKVKAEKPVRYMGRKTGQNYVWSNPIRIAPVLIRSGYIVGHPIATSNGPGRSGMPPLEFPGPVRDSGRSVPVTVRSFG